MKNLFKSFKTRVVLFSLITGLPFIMCSPINDDCNCDPVTGEFFDIHGIEVINQYKKTGENSIDIIAENEIVPFEKYNGLSVNYAVNYITNIPKKKSSFSSIYSAYACSCIYNGEAGSKNEKYANITVITLNDFDEAHRANDTINDLMLVKDEYLSDYLQNDTINIRYQGIRLMLDRKPVLNQNFKAKVVVELSTGEIYQDESYSIIIQ